VDRLTDGVRRLPRPAWSIYLGLGVALSLLYLAPLLTFVQWETGLASVVFFGFLNGVTPLYLLALIHYLDDSAAAALARFRPVLTVDETGYDQLGYQLTTLPARPTWIAAGLSVVYTFSALALNTLTAQRAESGGTAATVTGQQAESGVPAAVFVVLNLWSNLLIYVLVFVAIYHTLHQLRLVSTIYTRHTRINLFQQGPLYAFSSLTARTAIGIGLPTYVWFQANSAYGMGTSASDIIQTVFLGSLIVVTFVWPLLGAHRLLEREKQRLRDEVGRRIEATLATLHQRADVGDLQDFAAQGGVLDRLLVEQGVIDKLRTWPWRTETVGGLGVAFFVPIVIWIVQRILERLGV
jgi:hypothetical protein